MFPIHRPRRLRRGSALRDMVRETHVRPDDLIYPLFVDETATGPVEIQAMPGQFRHTIDSLCRQAEKAAEAGIKALILFGIPSSKDPLGEQAYADDGIVQQAVRRLKGLDLPLLVITDVPVIDIIQLGFNCQRDNQQANSRAKLNNHQ